MMTNIKNSTVVNEGPWNDQTARWLAMRIITVQSGIARWLQHLERKLNRTEKKVLLILFCLLSGGYCLCLLGNAIYGMAPSAHIGIRAAAHLTIISPLPEGSYGRPYADTLLIQHHPAHFFNHKNRPQ